MRCPFCGNDDTQVKDSRPTDDNAAIRRRRQCPNCGARFTTFERVQLRELTVVKTNGQREPFDRDKLVRSMQIALRKRPVDPERVERVVNGIVRRLESSGESEIPSTLIGEMVMDALANLDQVAYVRFASVYRNFREAKDFEEFVGKLGSRSRLSRPSPAEDVAHMRAALALARARPGPRLAQSGRGLRPGARDGTARGSSAAAGPSRAAGPMPRPRRWPAPAMRPAAPPPMSRSSPARTIGKTPPCAEALIAAGVAPRRRGHRGSRSAGQRARHRGAAGGRYRGRARDRRRRRRAEINAGFLTAPGPGPAAGGAEAGHHARRPHRHGQRRQPLDHRPRPRAARPPAARHP